MATKKKSAATQLKELRIEHAAAEQLVGKLTKERDSEKSSKDVWHKRSEEANNEIEQVHAFIDALPGAIARTVPVGEYGGRISHGLMTRLAAWLAVRP